MGIGNLESIGVGGAHRVSSLTLNITWLLRLWKLTIRTTAVSDQPHLY